MAVILNHNAYVEYAHEVMYKATGKGFTNCHRNSNMGYPVPDLISSDRKICVEVGSLSTTDGNHLGRIEALLSKYEQVWWFCHPDEDKMLPMLFINCIVFKRSDAKLSEKAQIFADAVDNFDEWQHEQLKRAFEKKKEPQP